MVKSNPGPVEAMGACCRPINSNGPGLSRLQWVVILDQGSGLDSLDGVVHRDVFLIARRDELDSADLASQLLDRYPGLAPLRFPEVKTNRILNTETFSNKPVETAHVLVISLSWFKGPVAR